MQQPLTISTEAISHLSQMAALYGYELKPLLPPVIQMQPGTADIKIIARKKVWTPADTAAAIRFCKTTGIGCKLPGLFNTLTNYQ